jgi:hypothetical protein
MSEFIIKHPIERDEQYWEALESLKTLTHAFLDLNDFANATSVLTAILRLQADHEANEHGEPQGM